MTTPTLFDPPPLTRSEQHAVDARAWLALHPEAAAWLLEQARTLARERGRVGVKALCERYRWDFPAPSDGRDFKLNNNHSAEIAAWLAEHGPELDAAIERRRK